MKNYEKEVLKARLDAEANELKHLKAIYNKASEDIIKKIEISNGKINVLLSNWDNLTEEEKSIYQSQIYQRDFQKSLKTQIDGFLKDLNSKQYATMTEYMEDCYKNGYLGAMYSIHKQGIPIISPIDQKKVTKAMFTDSKISKKLYTKLGEDVEVLKKRIANNISRGIATASDYKVIARNIAADSNVGFNRAMRITRTEGNRISNESAYDASMSAKDKGADVVKSWDAALDGRTRESHARVDGEIRELDEKFSNGLKYPGDSSGGAAEVVNCRCALLQRAKWALDDDELETLKERAAFYGLDKTNDFNDFKNKYLKAAKTIENSEKSDKIEPGNNPWNFNAIQGNHAINDDIGTFGSPVCNPQYSTGQWGYTQNCQRCVTAYEFRRRGYDVIATKRPKRNNQIVWGTECFTDANGKAVVFTHFQSAKQVRDELNNAPDGARYSIFVQWTSRSSHVFVAEKEAGVVRYVDPQSGKTDVADYFKKGLSYRFGFFRMDDKLITSDNDLVKKVVESAKNG